MKRWIIGVFFTVTFILSGAGYWLLATTDGLRLTLKTVVDTLQLPLSYSNLQGTILSGIRADSAKYDDETVTVNINQFETRFSVRPLLIGHLSFSNIKSQSVEVVLKENSGSDQVETSQDVTGDIKVVEEGIPVVISLRDAQIKILHVKQLQEEVFSATNIALGKGKISSNFSFRNLSFAIEQGGIDATGAIGFHQGAEVNLDASWKTNARDNLPDASGKLSAKGTYEQLKIDAQANSPEVVFLTGALDNLFSELSWKASIQAEKFPFSIVNASYATELRGFSMNAAGSLTNAEISGQTEIWNKEFGKLSAMLDGSISESHIELRELKIKSLDSEATISVTGSTPDNFSYKDMGPFLIKTSWEKLQWPLTDKPLLLSNTGQGEASGFVNDYRVKLIDTELNVEENGITDLNISGSGNMESLQLTDISASYLSGLWRGRGQLAWGKELQWNTVLSVKGINPAAQWPDWPAKLNAHAEIAGLHVKDTWDIKGNISKVRGELAGLPIDHASLDFELAENVYTVKNLKFVSKQNRLRGAVLFKTFTDKNPFINASWNIDSKNLSQLIPEARGSLKSDGHLLGELDAPQISTSVQAKDLSYKDNKLSSVDGVVNVDPKIGSELFVRLKLEGLNLDGIEIQNLALRGAGTTGDHEIKYSSRMDTNRSLSWSARGGYENGIWKGKLNSSSIKTTNFGNWQLQGPSNVSISDSRLNLDYFCLAPVDVDARVCVKVDSDYFESWSGAVNVKDLPVETFRSFFPPQIFSVKGLVNGSANYQFHNSEIKILDANLVSNKGSVEYGLLTNERQNLDYHQLQASINHTGQGISIVSKVDLRETGEIDLRATLKDKHDLGGIDDMQKIDGKVLVELKNLMILPLIYPDIQFVDGHKFSKYTISGTIGHPVVVGHSDFVAKSLTLPRLGIELKDVKAKARSDENNNITVTGEASSGGGKINFQGEMLDYLSGKISAKLHIQGNNFLANKTPGFVMAISPDITATVSNDLMRMEGTVTVPSASIQMMESTSTVAPSGDVVIVDADQPADKVQNKMALDAELKIVLGDDVNIEGFGANGRLRGEVLVREQPGSVTTGRGEIWFEDGRFSAYNRELKIETGKLTFANSPIDNPIVTIQAVRNIDRQDVKVKVGVEVTGQAQNPKVELFSEPTMDQSDILSYMILGYPMNQATEKDGSTLSTAASSIGLIGGELLANEIATKLGIDIENIRITTDAATKQPLVGAYLNPRLYAEYVMGVGQAVNTFRIEYNLTNRWVFKTETSSEQQGADLLYTIELD